MDDLSHEEFQRMKQNASERVMQMHKSQTGLPPFPDFVSVPNRQQKHDEPQKAELTQSKESMPAARQQSSHRIGSLIKYINLPEMMKNSDSLLLLGLILLLSSESADETLILALAYILL